MQDLLSVKVHSNWHRAEIQMQQTTRCVKESTLESSINLPGPFKLSVAESTLERHWIHYCVTQNLPARSSQIIPPGLIWKTKESSYLFNGSDEKQKKHILLTRKLNRMIQDQVIHQAWSHFKLDDKGCLKITILKNMKIPIRGSDLQWRNFEGQKFDGCPI